MKSGQKEPFLWLFPLAFAVCCVAGVGQAQDFRGARERAFRELEPFFAKQVTVSVALERTSGPDWMEKLFGRKYKLVGCPQEPVAPPESVKELLFKTERPGPWAGAVDGVNVAVSSIDGSKGGGFAVPSNSTARLPDDRRGPEFEFFFDGTLNVSRALVDAAAAEFDRCFSQLPAGRYSSEELQSLCPYRPVPRSQEMQTCVVSVRGVVGKPLPDGLGLESRVFEETVCDLVGYGKPDRTATNFVTCFSNEYQGVALLSAEPVPITSEQRSVKSG